MKDRLYNQRFDDIYFSPEDGLAETKHVFLEGNRLPQAWADADIFTIVETGFGTGLNFLSAWRLFEQERLNAGILDYVSFEKFPLSRERIQEILAPWRDDFEGRIDRLCAAYPLDIRGFHRLSFGNVNLTLVYDDINDALPQLSVPGGVDAWFLDGFAPAKNPDMWTPVLYENMKRLSRAGATVATFTAAGAIRRGLAEHGFNVEKVAGYGRKRDMITASYTDTKAESAQNLRYVRRVAIIGGGLAGTACAYVLKQRGLEPVIFESQDIAAGASGNANALYNPRFTAQRDSIADFYNSAFALAYRTLSAPDFAQRIAFNACGALHLVNTQDKERRFASFCESNTWSPAHARLLFADEASAVAGLPVASDALYLPESGTLSPRTLCQAYVRNCECVTNSNMSDIQAEGEGWRLDGRHFDAVILASGVAVKDFAQASWLPLHSVRGQISEGCFLEAAPVPNCNICYGGYFAPTDENHFILGSTFQKWRDDIEVSQDDHDENYERLINALPVLEDKIRIKAGRAALRTVSKDHLPVIGALPDYESWQSGKDGMHENLYVSTAHGSHGILSSLMGACLLADAISGTVPALPEHARRSVSPARFLDRARRKGQL